MRNRFFVVLYSALFVFLTPIMPSVAEAGIYINSAEAICDEADPNILKCDDFEDGTWIVTDCDNGGPGDPDNDGWCGWIYTPPDPLGQSYGRCGDLGVGGTNCTATSGVRGGTSGMMADFDFVGQQGVDEVYIRYYEKLLPGFDWGHEKMLTINPCCHGGGGIVFGVLHSHFGGGISAFLNLDEDFYRYQNQGNDIVMAAPNWYFIEMHLKLNTVGQANGTYELWIDNCGSDGLGCTGTPTLRSQYTNVELRLTGIQIGTVWVEGWSNAAPESTSTGETYYDQFVVSKTGPIGFMDSGTWSVIASLPEGASCVLGDAECDNIDVTQTGSGTATGDILAELDCDNSDGLQFDGTGSGDTGFSDDTTAANPKNYVDGCDLNALGAGTYTITVRSTRDGNEDTDTIDFVINPSDTTAPALSNGLPTGEQQYDVGTVTLSVMTSDVSLPVACRWSTVDEAYSDMGVGDTFTAVTSTLHEDTIAVSNDTSYTYYAACIDDATNENGIGDNLAISFSVAAAGAAPVISNANDCCFDLPAISENTLIEVQTDEVADCKYDFDPGVAYAAQSNTLDSVNGLNHILYYAGLFPSYFVNVYVKCSDGTNISDDFTVEISVDGAVSGGSITGGSIQ